MAKVAGLKLALNLPPKSLEKEQSKLDSSQHLDFTAIVADVTEIKTKVTKQHAEVCDNLSMLITTVQCAVPAFESSKQFVLPSVYKIAERKPQV